MSEPDSEPAFPQHANTGNMEFWRLGMSLRDYFAAQALTGVIGRATTAGCTWDAVEVAGWAYAVADAMLEASAK